MNKNIMNLKTRGCMLAQIDDIDVMYLNHITDHLSKENDDHIRKYWIKELREYINIFEKKLLSPNQRDYNSPSISTKN